MRPGQRISEAEAERLLLEDLAPVEAAIARSITVPLTDGQHGALVSFAFNLGHSTAPGKPLANIAATLNRGEYDGAIRRMGLYAKQRRNGRLVSETEQELDLDDTEQRFREVWAHPAG